MQPKTSTKSKWTTGSKVFLSFVALVILFFIILVSNTKVAEVKAEPVVVLTPHQKDSIARDNLIQDQFKTFDGSNRKLVKYVKGIMNDPESFEHVKTVFWNAGNNIIVKMDYRGKNSFGALVLGSATAEMKPDGTILSVK